MKLLVYGKLKGTKQPQPQPQQTDEKELKLLDGVDRADWRPKK